MTVTAISDTHGFHHDVEVPVSEVLLSAGDAMTDGWDLAELQDFVRWFKSQPHEHKIYVAGNHDRLLERLPHMAPEIFRGIHYLHDSGVTINGRNFWGSPYQPEFCGWAFNLERGHALKKHWDLIPDNTNVLITHGPPRGYGDRVMCDPKWPHLGCDDLAAAVLRVKPAYHIFGHIHGGHGLEVENGTCYINASVLDEAYNVSHPGRQFTI